MGKQTAGISTMSWPLQLKKIGRGTRIFSQHNFGANCCIFHEDGVGFRFLDFGIWNLDLDQFACAAEQSSSRIGIKPSLCQDDWQGDSVLLQTWRQKFLTKLASCQTVSGHHTHTYTATKEALELAKNGETGESSTLISICIVIPAAHLFVVLIRKLAKQSSTDGINEFPMPLRNPCHPTLLDYKKSANRQIGNAHGLQHYAVMKKMWSKLVILFENIYKKSWDSTNSNS